MSQPRRHLKVLSGPRCSLTQSGSLFCPCCLEPKTACKWWRGCWKVLFAFSAEHFRLVSIVPKLHPRLQSRPTVWEFPQIASIARLGGKWDVQQTLSFSPFFHQAGLCWGYKFRSRHGSRKTRWKGMSKSRISMLSTPHFGIFHIFARFWDVQQRSSVLAVWEGLSNGAENVTYGQEWDAGK
jgi:hypothetical protein